MPGDMHDYLVKTAAKWLLRKRHCRWILLEPHAWCIEFPDVIGWDRMGWSTLVECKATRSDFLRDRDKSFRRGTWEIGMGQRRIYATAKGVIKSVGELPDRWGWIELGPRGFFRVLREPAPITEVNADVILREMQVLLPALRRGVKGYGDRPWLMFNPKETPDEEPKDPG